ncbi:hypothetical protein [Kordia sp.]|uniref:hypothetical protein n=1 Tax=Kordia sp. TaxID=1965332 RepID=UPI003D2AA37F
MYKHTKNKNQNSFQSVAEQRTIQQKRKHPIQLVDNRTSSKKAKNMFNTSKEVIQKADDWKTGSLKNEHKKAKEYPESYLASGAKAVASGVVAGGLGLVAGAAATTAGIAGLAGAGAYGLYNLWNRKSHADNTHTLHHKVAKSKLEDHYGNLPSGQKPQMLTAMGLDPGDGRKAIKSFRPNLTLGKAPDKRSITDPGQGFDGNVSKDGSHTPRSRHLRRVDQLIDGGGSHADINTALSDSLAAHNGRLDTTSNKTEIDKRKRKLKMA